MHEVPTAGMKDSAGLNAPNVDRMNAFANSGHGQPIPEGPGLGSTFGAADMGCDLDDTFSFEMISLGLEEPLPTQDVIDELFVFPFLFSPTRGRGAGFCFSPSPPKSKHCSHLGITCSSIAWIKVYQ